MVKDGPSTPEEFEKQVRDIVTRKLEKLKEKKKNGGKAEEERT